MHRIVILLTTFCVLLAAGCGAATPPEPTPDAADNAAATTADESAEQADAAEEADEAAAPAPEPVIITLAYNRFLQTSFTDSPPPFEVIATAVAAEYPNIEIELNLVPNSISAHRDALAVWMSAEDPTIDIYGIDTPWVPEFGEAGWAEPLNEHLPNLEDTFIDSGLEVFTYEGQRIGVPFWGSIGGMFYRTDLLEEYGFEPPETYDDLTEIVETITAEEPDLSGFVWPGAREESLVQTWVEIFGGYGGEYFDESGACTINSPEGVAAVSFMVDSIESGISPRETTAWNAEEARTRFVEGDAIFLRHNHDIVTWLDDPERSAVIEQWGFMSNPAQPAGEPSGATGGFAFAINPYTDTMEESIQVLEIIASEEVQRGFALAWGPVQYYEGLYQDPEVQAANPNADLIEDVLDSATRRPPSSNYAQLSDILQEELHAALTGIKPVETALDDACSRIDALP
jgi:multiple sugar transport system substrate-binding protein